MGTRLFGMVLDGIEAKEVTLEARFSAALRPVELRIVGLPEAAVKEGMVRARSAAWPLVSERLRNSSAGILVNLAPADLKKSGRMLDLPLAMVYTALAYEIEGKEDLVFVGEVGLAGEVRAVAGILPAMLRARAGGRSAVIVPTQNVAEACLVTGPEIYGVRTVGEAFEVLSGRGTPVKSPRGLPNAESRHAAPDLADVRGQWQARRALEITAAGGHNLLLEGPPGSGKTLLARRLPSILPQLHDLEALETAVVQSATQSFDPECIRERPFRSPHHSATPAGLVGGGQPLRPGEFTKAHRGVLFLDEFPEFDRRALEYLREPLEEHVVHLSRAGVARSFPADFLCVAAMNPCPCGFHGLRDGRCRCTPRAVQAYRGRLSGPLLDRFDLRIFLSPVPGTLLLDEQDGESSAVVRERVLSARDRAKARFRDAAEFLNGRVSDRALRLAASLGVKERACVVRLVTANHLSARAAHRLLRVARTIADLAACDRLEEVHLMEAAAYRLTQDLENRGGIGGAVIV